MAIYKAKAWQDVLKANSPALLSMSFEINTVGLAENDEIELCDITFPINIRGIHLYRMDDGTLRDFVGYITTDKTNPDYTNRVGDVRVSNRVQANGLNKPNRVEGKMKLTMSGDYAGSTQKVLLVIQYEVA